MPTTYERVLASGNVAVVDSDTNKVIEIIPAEDVFEFFDEGPTCSICDGLGHGYPGGPPCPIEDRGYNDGPGHVWER